MNINSNFSGPIFSSFTILNTKDLPGYPLYPPNEDIYKKALKVEDIDFEEITKTIPKTRDWNEKNIKEDPFGGDLDVPGSELDDDQEAIGNEDEENNSYSLSQDEQSDIEEN